MLPCPYCRVIVNFDIIVIIDNFCSSIIFDNFDKPLTVSGMKSKIPDKASSASVSLTESMWYYLNGQPEGKSGYLQKLLREDMESSDSALPSTAESKCIELLVGKFAPAYAQIAQNVLGNQDQSVMLAKVLEGLVSYLTDRKARELNPDLPPSAYNVHIQFTGRPSIDLPDEFELAAEPPSKYRVKKIAKPRKKA